MYVGVMMKMMLNDLISKVRRYTRDTTGSLFTQEDIADFCNEGIQRMKQTILELKNVNTLQNNTDEVIIIPSEYQHLIAVYSASRCFSQDEQQYQATTYMNEFETKVNELKTLIASGDVVLYDELGVPIPIIGQGGIDYVIDVYFFQPVIDEWSVSD